MNTILNYLENMFLNLPKSERVLKAKEELLAMMEDKYQELKAEGKTENEAVGIVISEFGNLEELAEELGLGSYLNADGKIDSQENLRIVSKNEVLDYLEMMKKSAAAIARGVMLCILSPVIILLLEAVYGNTPAAPAAELAGTVMLLILIALAIPMFIVSGMRMSKYEWMSKESFQLDYETVKYVENQRDTMNESFGIRIALGVVLCILSVIPVIVSEFLFGDDSAMETGSFAILLVIVSVAVFLFITTGIRKGALSTVLQEGDYTPEEKKLNANPLVHVFSTVYWLIVTAVYLGLSFWNMEWHRTWLIWAVAGVLYAAVYAVFRYITQKSKNA